MVPVELISEIPRIEVQIIEKAIPCVRTEAREVVQDVPQVMYEERIIEVPETQVAEYIKQVPVQQYQEVAKQIPKYDIRVVDKVVSVPATLIQESVVEVPQVQNMDVMRQVPGAQAVVTSGAMTPTILPTTYSRSGTPTRMIEGFSRGGTPTRFANVAGVETYGAGYGAGYGGQVMQTLSAPNSSGAIYEQVQQGTIIESLQMAPTTTTYGVQPMVGTII